MLSPADVFLLPVSKTCYEAGLERPYAVTLATTPPPATAGVCNNAIVRVIKKIVVSNYIIIIVRSTFITPACTLLNNMHPSSVLVVSFERGA